MAIEILQIILTAFFSGLGTGLSNWLIVRRLEKIELNILKKK